MENENFELYTSISLKRLKSQLALPMTLMERALLLTKIAANLARSTRTAEARAVIKEVRAVNRKYDPLLSSWVMFCEGLIYHFETLHEYQAFDRFRRAYIFAVALKDRELASSCAAWIAQCELVANKYSSMHEHLIAAFEWADPEHGDARARASAVIAISLNMAGQTESARDWYRIARGYAVAEGDIAMQNMILFNTAACSVSNLVYQDCFGAVEEKDRWRAMMELNSATNLDLTLGSQRLQSLTPLLRAELYTVERNWEGAITIYSEHVAKSMQEGHRRHEPRHLANCAWCHDGCNRPEIAWTMAQEAIQCIDQCSDPDDLAVIHLRISEVAKGCGEHDAATRHAVVAREHRLAYEQQQIELSAALTSTLAVIEKIESTKKKNPT